MSRPTSGRLREEHHEAIQKNYREIKAEIEPKKMVDYLFSAKFLTNDDKETILSKTSREDRAEALLQKVLHCGPGEGFKLFLEALELAGYDHLVDVMNTGIKERLQNQLC